MTRGEQRWHELDLLRGIAILGVLAVHAINSSPTPVHHLNSVIALGRFGVQLFYIASAITMCFMWTRRSDESHRTVKFYIRRVARIAPLFWIAILLYLAVEGRQPRYWAPGGIGLRQIVLTSSFLHGIFPDSINAIVPGGWSIAVEMTFYLFFPLFIRLGTRPQVYLFCAIGLSIANWFLLDPLCVAIYSPSYHGATAYLLDDFRYLNFFNQCPAFLLGIYLYFRAAAAGSPTRLEIGATCAWVALTATLFAVHQVRFDALLLVLVLAFQLALSYIILRKKLHIPPLEYLGQRSYSIYLSHPLMLAMLSSMGVLMPMHLPATIVFIGTLGGMAGLAVLLSIPIQRYVETVVQRQVARMLTRWN